MNTSLISIGSNFNKYRNLSLCKQFLLCFDEKIYFSDIIETKPYGKKYKSDFLNQLIYIETMMSFDKLNTELKKIERELERFSYDKPSGIVTIDIDILKYNNTILKTKDWEREYVLLLLPSLASNFQLNF